MAKKLKGSRKAERGVAAPPTTKVKARGRDGVEPPPEPERAGRIMKAAVKGKVRSKAINRLADVIQSREPGAFRRELGKLARRRTTLAVLERLELAIEEVRLGGRESPRTRRLLAAGVPKMAQKVIEEAGEAAIEAVRRDPAALVNETADLFYNVLVMLSAAGVPLAAVWREMDRREVTIGMAEKLPKMTDVDS